MKGFSRLSADISSSDKGLQAATIIGFLLVILSWSGLLDQLSNDFVDGTIVQAALAFGLARGFNAVVSMAQSIDIQISIGAGVSVAIGELLDPINDLVEDFASVMKLSLGSLIIQKLLLEIVADGLFKVLLTISAISAFLAFWIQQETVRLLLIRTFITLAFLRFILVIVAILSGSVDRIFLEDVTNQQINAAENVPYNVEALTQGMPPEEQAALEQQVVEINQDVSEIDGELIALLSTLVELQTQYQIVKEQRSDLVAELGWGDRLNLFSENESIDSLDATLSDLNDDIDATEDTIESVQDSQEDLKEDRDLIQSTLNGDTVGLLSFSGALERIKRLSSILNPTSLYNSLENSVDTILRLMAVFLLKTIGIPLLFLFACTRFFNKIWSTNLSLKIPKRQDPEEDKQ